jgi:hypothetical protein
MAILIAVLALGYDRGLAVFAALLLVLVVLPEALRLVMIRWIDPVSLRVMLSGAALVVLALTGRERRT